jgi:cyclophilin family peptidyl-prolyl cis-trans isomerase/HEAT repeat protein
LTIRPISLVSAAATALVLAACGPVPPPKLPAVDLIPERQKMAWILQLEDQRILRLDLPAPAPPPAPVKGKKPAPVVVPPKPSSTPDLAVLVRDADPRLRRRAALAVGRVRAKAGIPILTALLTDTDPDVRAMSAFALGLIGDASAESALTPLLADAAPLVRGRAAEGLGLIGAKGSAAAIGQMVAAYAKSPAVTSKTADDETVPLAAEAEAFKLGLYALVRLGAYDPLAAAVLDGDRPVIEWWPVAYALQRIDDARATAALRALLGANGRYTRAFAARGLGRLKDTASVKPLVALLQPSAKAGLEVTVAAMRALGQLGAGDAATPLAEFAVNPSAHPNIRLEAVLALTELRAPDSLPFLQDLMTDDWPALRAAAFKAAAAVDPERYVAVLAGMDSDRHWRVRAAVAETLGMLPAEQGQERLRSMLQDEDKRVVPQVLASLTRLKTADLGDVLLKRLEDPDFAVRAAAARHLGTVKPAGGADALRRAYAAGQKDLDFAARAAALEALTAYGASEAGPTLREALADKDWAIRVRADELLTRVDAADTAPRTIAPVPSPPIVPYDDPLLAAPVLSPHAFIETAHGTIEFELAVLDAPQACRSFVELVRKGFFDHVELHRVLANFVVQGGDPRGDGAGGPGYSIRDELNDRPYLRGTVGMALDWRDTGGSQFFITLSPQPHLDAKYTAFGHVVNGLEILDRLRPGDVIQRVRVWNGSGWVEGPK